MELPQKTKKDKTKSKKSKKDKAKDKKKLKKAGITININVGGSGGGSKNPKQPKAPRNFVPRATALRGQRGKGDLHIKGLQAETNTNLFQGLYGVRSQANRQADLYMGLSGDVGLLRSRVDFLGAYVQSRTGRETAPTPAPAPAPAPAITINTPDIRPTFVLNQGVQQEGMDEIRGRLDGLQNTAEQSQRRTEEGLFNLAGMTNDLQNTANDTQGIVASNGVVDSMWEEADRIEQEPPRPTLHAIEPRPTLHESSSSPIVEYVEPPITAKPEPVGVIAATPTIPLHVPETKKTLDDVFTFGPSNKQQQEGSSSVPSDTPSIIEDNTKEEQVQKAEELKKIKGRPAGTSPFTKSTPESNEIVRQLAFEYKAKSKKTSKDPRYIKLKKDGHDVRKIQNKMTEIRSVMTSKQKADYLRLKAERESDRVDAENELMAGEDKKDVELMT
jgi:hypothetical protein